MGWIIKIDKAFIPEMVYVLDERFYLTHYSTFFRLILSLFDFYPISSQCFAEDCNQRPITGKKYTVQLVLVIHMVCCYIKTHKCFSGTRYTSNKTNCLLRIISR